MERPVYFPQVRGAPETPAFEVLAIGEGDLVLAEPCALGGGGEHDTEAEEQGTSPVELLQTELCTPQR